MAWYVALIGLVAVERLVELVISKRNIDWALERGGREFGFGHYPFMVVLHLALLICPLLEVALLDRPFLPWLGWPMLALVVASQALRWWCITTLGSRWNTRVVIVPGLPLVRTGPYRWGWLRHPNYVAVIVEGAALPLVHSAWLTALGFTLLNAALLRVRIRTENRALTLCAAPLTPATP